MGQNTLQITESPLRRALREGILYVDGGMGSLLAAEADFTPGSRPEWWSITHEDVIYAIHEAYLASGANLLTTNTFGANRLHYKSEELSEVVNASVRLACRARDAAEKKDPTSKRFVLLDVGPLGVLLRPFGTMPFETAVETFKETIRLGVAAGVDGILIETMSDSYETKAAVLAAKETCDLPILVTNTYDSTGKLMTGADPTAMVALLEGLSVDAIGLNCSTGPCEMLRLVEALYSATSLPVIVSPNAGLPRVNADGETVYDVSPDEFAACMVDILAAGGRILGGCCGTTPAHICALVEATKGKAPLPILWRDTSLISSFTHAVRIGGERPILIGERINPTGKKALKEALRRHDIDHVLALAEKQEKEGADVLDVNVGLPEIDETAMLSEIVTALQQVTDLPLQIDTGSPDAMEAACRLYNGKPLLNSVTGEEEKMAAIFPIAKRYGGMIVALTLDENGIPDTAEGRLAIAERIVCRAEEYGIDRKDLLFDPLALTVSSDIRAPRVTLDAITLIRDRLGCHTSLGVSNVSFGLPKRDLLNGAFFTLALERGLSAAIMNPASAEMQKAYHAFLTLWGLDDHCAGYVDFAARLGDDTAQIASVSAPAHAERQGSPLFAAILSGRREAAVREADALGASLPPLSVISDEIIPALDVVGREFEQGKRFLPQLLASAEAAKGAFDALSRYFSAEAETKGSVILATVEGDIHDIGKNIVRVVLESYGYRVLDLGRDVKAETILDAARRENITFVGLSALMTTTVPAMERTIALLKAELPQVRIVVGGAVMTAEYAEMIHADGYCKDAMDALRAAEAYFSEGKH